jgi:hypothetical protein
MKEQIYVTRERDMKVAILEENIIIDGRNCNAMVVYSHEDFPQLLISNWGFFVLMNNFKCRFCT